MAQSKIKTMRQLSRVLFLVVIVALAVSVRDFQLGDSGAGIQSLAVASGSVVLLLAVTMPVQCRVETTRGEPCKNWSYGIFLGCGRVPSHRLAKLYKRLGWQQQAVKALTHRGRNLQRSSPAAVQSASQDRQDIFLTVADTTITKCGFWVGVVGTAAGVAGVIVSVLGLH